MNSKDLRKLKAGLAAEYDPADKIEQYLVNEMAENYFRVSEYRDLEDLMLAAPEPNLNKLKRLQRLMSRAEDQFHRALTALSESRKQRCLNNPARVH